MMYKFFTNKHDLINELQSESLKRVLADESWDERIENEKMNESQEKIQANDLDEKTEAFWMSVRRESQADE